MTASSPSPALPPRLLERLLQTTPVDILLFDTALICRYAAPADDTLFGRTAAELVGRTATEIFPPAAEGLHPMLERAAREASTWSSRDYRYTYRAGSTATLYCWSIRVEPVAAAGFEGVQVTLADVQDLVDDGDRLRAEAARLGAELAAAQRRVSRLATALAEVQTGVRTLLTPVRGYLQLVTRRPQALGGRSSEAVVEADVLPHLEAIVEAVDRAVLHDERSPSDA